MRDTFHRFRSLFNIINSGRMASVFRLNLEKKKKNETKRDQIRLFPLKISLFVRTIIRIEAWLHVYKQPVWINFIVVNGISSWAMVIYPIGK